MLRQRFDKVLYLDLDVHHGDGVENAFNFSPKVLTMSAHLREDGFFPGTGNLEDIGQGRGKYCNLNIPLKAGIDDKDYLGVMLPAVKTAMALYDPHAVVVQCGADALATDPFGGFSLTQKSYGEIVKCVLEAGKPTLLLGGGGYVNKNAALLWTYLTGVVLGIDLLDEDVPLECPHYKDFGPSFDVTFPKSYRKNENSKSALSDLNAKILKHLHNLPGAVKENYPLSR